jgi:hypothetical protein
MIKHTRIPWMSKNEYFGTVGYVWECAKKGGVK